MLKCQVTLHLLTRESATHTINAVVNQITQNHSWDQVLNPGREYFFLLDFLFFIGGGGCLDQISRDLNQPSCPTLYNLILIYSSAMTGSAIKLSYSLFIYFLQIFLMNLASKDIQICQSIVFTVLQSIDSEAQ